MFALAACDQAPEPIPSWGEAAIQERGVAGVLFGETVAETLRELGHPETPTMRSEIHMLGYSGTQTVSDGAHTWSSLSYRSGPLNGFKAYYRADRDTIPSAYPADFFVIESPFPGKTEQGIGIGSTETEFLDRYGPAAYADSGRFQVGGGTDSLRTYYFYITCIGRREFGVSVNAGRIVLMQLGYHFDDHRVKVECPAHKLADPQGANLMTTGSAMPSMVRRSASSPVLGSMR
ncbi:MAG: hypothetical protein RhofKO_05970 [Rhodothermales bacterium]